MQTYEPRPGDSIQQAARILVGMANSAKEPAMASFNDIVVTANPGDDADSIVQYYHAESNRGREEYINSPEYKEKQQQAEEKQLQHELALEGALQGAPEKMSLRDEAGWKQFVEVNTDGYGSGVIRFAERWARLMEGRIAKGDTMEKFAKETSHLADNEGITGFMYGCAVSILSKVWVHGEQLQRWHNKSIQLGTEGDRANEQGGVLNPALLSIG